MEDEFENYGMEMPCLCDCGKWFDLNDGVGSYKNTNSIVCQSCGEIEEAEAERNNEIVDLLYSLADAEFTIKEVNERLKELNYDPEKDKDYD